MPRFYCKLSLPSSGSFVLPPEAAHHAVRVLRLKEGDKVEIFDGIGNERRAEIIEATGKIVVLGNIASTDVSRESSLKIILAQALTSSDKMDWVLQKATELGVSELQPLNTERSVARLPPERVSKRMEHWHQVTIAACEQCGRNTLPHIYTPSDIMPWFQQMRDRPEAKLILLPDGTESLPTRSSPKRDVVLLIGAEGGFTPAEAGAAMGAGFNAIRMGPRVMRTETAAIAGLAALQTLWGDFQ